MSFGRLAIAAVLALALVLTATFVSALLLMDEGSGEEHVRPKELAALARASYDRDTSTTRLLLHQLCNRDVNVERLALELSAGGTAEADAPRTAVALGRSLAADVWLLLATESGVRALGSSGKLRSLPLSRSALADAVERPVALRAADGQSWLVLFACARDAADAQLWIVRAEPLSSWRARALPASDSYELIEAAGDTRAPRKGALLALSVPGAGGGEAVSLWLRGEQGFSALPAGLWPLVLLAIVFGALLAYYAVGREPIDSAVLVELEKAAERVAMGDLTSRIERRAGGRADQTFRTFDRMTEELRDMRTRLAEAERATAWQDMARRIAHEIKNPLTPIQMAMETLRSAHAKRLPIFDEIFEESTRAILEEVRRLERIVREFSEFARLPKPRPGLLELGALLDDTVGLYRPDDVQVDVMKAQGAIEVRVDREQIAQVLVNLLQNALVAARASPSPRVMVHAELRPAEGAARSAFVHVDDNGAGVPSADRARIFEPYYTTKEHGSGLGLAIARRIALDHHGSLHVSDSPLGGARFTLRLPYGEQIAG
jgi:signal transduction histidine kinase